MAQHSPEADNALVQEALELRHDVEALIEHSRRLYERANRLVELTRHLLPPPATADAPEAVAGGA